MPRTLTSDSSCSTSGFSRGLEGCCCLVSMEFFHLRPQRIVNREQRARSQLPAESRNPKSDYSDGTGQIHPGKMAARVADSIDHAIEIRDDIPEHVNITRQKQNRRNGQQRLEVPLNGLVQ